MRPQHRHSPSLPSLLWRRVGKLIGCLFLGLAAAVAWTAFAPWTYTSEAMLFLRLGRETANLDPTDAAAHSAVGEDLRESALNSLAELFKSRAVREELVDALGPETVLETDTLSPGPVGSQLRQLHLLGPYSPREKAIRHAAEGLSLTSIKKSSLLVLRYRAHCPETARDLLTRLIALARQRQVRVLQTAGSKELFETQVESQRKQLDELESQRRALRDRFGIVAFDRQRDAHVARTSAMETELAQTENSLAAVDAEIAAHRKSLEMLPETIVVSETKGQPNSATEGMRQQAFALEIKLQEMLVKYQPDTVFVKDVRDQLEGLKHALALETNEMQVARGTSQAHQEISLALLKARSQRDALAARQAGAARQLAAALQQIKQFNERESQLAEFDLRIDLERENYRTYARSLEQIRIDDAIARQSLSNVNVLQEPTLSPVPTSPVLAVNLGLGLFLGLCAGLVGIVFSERRRGPASQHPEVEEDLDMEKDLDVGKEMDVEMMSEVIK